MILIKNGNINTVTNGEIKGDILIKNKKIEKIAEAIDTTCLEDVEVIDAEGLNVFPGFIDAHTHLGLWEDGLGFEGADGNEETDPITPNLNPIDAINPMDHTFKEAYEGGITSVCVTPGSANVMGGQCIAIKTFGKRIDKMVIKNPVAVKIAFGENPKSCYGQEEKSPQTRMAIAATLRENFRKAQDYLEEMSFYSEADDNDIDKPEYDMKLESLIPVLRRRIPLKAHAHRADDIFTAIRIAKEFDLKLTIDHCTEGHLIVDELLEENGEYPIIVGPSLTDRSKPELRNLSLETAGILSNAGIEVSLMTDHPVIPVQHLPMCAGMAIKNGMKEDAALRAITINPAKTLGIDKKVGSLEEGKDADIVLWEGSPFDLGGKVMCTIIDGKVVYKR